jgi:hypothetical protein
MYGRTVAVVPGGIGDKYTITAACFTGRHAWFFASALLVGGLFLGAAGGAILGFLASFVTGPEPISKGVAAGIGAIVGAVMGTLFATLNVTAGKCSCPSFFDYAFCVYILWYTPRIGPSYPIAMMPAPAECKTLVPAGCP